MGHYDRRLVTAPGWLESFCCTAGDCPETCCQQWNIEVDPVHAESYIHLGDPDLHDVLGRLLHKIRVRRPGKKDPETQYLLQLLKEPDGRCPLLNEKGECRLQKKYGAAILCDTCYFHPRTFWQIDEQIYLSACLSCPECARLALLHIEPTVFSRFESEIDPDTEWLETSQMTDPDAGMLMRNRDQIISALCEMLQRRDRSMDERLESVVRFLRNLSVSEHPDINAIRDAAAGSEKDIADSVFPDDPAELMDLYLDVFDPVSETIEKPVQGAIEFTRLLAGGKNGFSSLLAGSYTEGCRIMDPFFAENEYLIENFMVHCVFSDSFKQFSRCRKESLKVRDILRHESALLQVWYLFLRVHLAQTALMFQTMNEVLFLQTVIHVDRTWWHYPDWFARCAERYADIR